MYINIIIIIVISLLLLLFKYYILYENPMKITASHRQFPLRFKHSF